MKWSHFFLIQMFLWLCSVGSCGFCRRTAFRRTPCVPCCRPPQCLSACLAEEEVWCGRIRSAFLTLWLRHRWWGESLEELKIQWTVAELLQDHVRVPTLVFRGQSPVSQQRVSCSVGVLVCIPPKLQHPNDGDNTNTIITADPECFLCVRYHMKHFQYAIVLNSYNFKREVL